MPKTTSLVLLIVLLGCGSPAPGVRAIPDDNLAYPVLVKHESGETGSGFYINSGSEIFLVTARHVLTKEPLGTVPELVSHKATLLSFGKDPSDPNKNIFLLDLDILARDNQIRYHLKQDVAIVRMGVLDVAKPTETKWHPITGVTVQSQHGIVWLDVNNINNFKRFANVLVANEVFLFGYPTCLGIPGYDRPLLRKGIISGMNRNMQTIILDCPAYPGNSGGPVTEVDRANSQLVFPVIGIMTDFVPVAMTQGNSGYSRIVPMDFVLELLDASQGKKQR